MEALLPPHVLHGDDDCNQLVAPFNTESEISHTARSSSDSRTDYDGGPLDTATATISDLTWKPSSSHDLQPTWALPLTAWVEQRHALGDVQIHATRRRRAERSAHPLAAMATARRVRAVI